MDAAKTALYDRLKIQEPGPGYCHFPIGRDEEYFDQLTAEKKYTRYHHGYPKQEWRKPATARNEARDCRVYAYAALHPLYASGLKLTVYCERFAQMGRSRRKEMQSIPPSVVVAQAEHLQVQNGNGFADDARQIQLHGALNLLVFAFGDMLADGFSRRSTALVATSSPASSFTG